MSLKTAGGERERALPIARASRQDGGTDERAGETTPSGIAVCRSGVVRVGSQ